MKKYKIMSIAAIVLTVSAIVFYACEKESKESHSSFTTNVQKCNDDLNLDSLITVRSQYFFQNYGLDLQSFSEEDDLREIIIEINEFSSDMFSFLENANTDRVSAMISFLQTTMDQLSECEYNEDLDCQITIAEMLYDSILPTKTRNTIEIDGITYLFPAIYLESKANTLYGLLHHLSILYPSLSNLEEEEYLLLLETAFIKSMLDGNASFNFAPIMAMQDPPQGSYESCVKKAAAVLAAELAVASVQLAIELAKCAPYAVTTVGYGICASIKGVVYASEVYSATSAYSNAVALCGYQYPH